PRQVLLCAHWDTRPWADRDPDIVNHRTPILGANDGASGVAILLEVARVLAQLRPRGIGFQFVFFDGEDYGPGIEDMFLGSRYFAANLPKVRPEYGILLDMVGDADLGVYQEGNSVARAPEVVERVWGAAAAAGYEASFPRQVAYTVVDDHIPLLDAGWSVIDVIDFRYPHWHTVGDTPDKCSAESLKAVGETVLKAVLTT
ncbi:MAG: M28 family peptidase, partial [Chloroflexi bacterium]|nr:M28 family peptidase [Chloroflexota bacterium]